MGRHRNLLNRLVAQELKLDKTSIEWLDFHFDSKEKWPDAELTGLEFLPNTKIYDSVRSEWDERWPHPRRGKSRPNQGNQNWDAVGVVRAGKTEEWIIVEAKAELKELKSSCGAESTKSKEQIRAELVRAREYLRIETESDWMKNYYQFANRLAILSFLHSQGVQARLLFIYFCGDITNNSRKCPKTRNEWQQAIRMQSDYIGKSRTKKSPVVSTRCSCR